MLIRTQDKTELVNMSNVTKISCIKNRIISEPVHDGQWTTLGNYSSEEKAVKVLDKIQQCYKHYSCRYGSDCSEFAVFEMPKEEEI